MLSLISVLQIYIRDCGVIRIRAVGFSLSRTGSGAPAAEHHFKEVTKINTVARLVVPTDEHKTFVPVGWWLEFLTVTPFDSDKVICRVLFHIREYVIGLGYFFETVLLDVPLAGVSMIFSRQRPIHTVDFALCRSALYSQDIVIVLISHLKAVH